MRCKSDYGKELNTALLRVVYFSISQVNTIRMIITINKDKVKQNLYSLENNKYITFFMSRVRL